MKKLEKNNARDLYILARKAEGHGVETIRAMLKDQGFAEVTRARVYQIIGSNKQGNE